MKTILITYKLKKGVGRTFWKEPWKEPNRTYTVYGYLISKAIDFDSLFSYTLSSVENKTCPTLT